MLRNKTTTGQPSLFPFLAVLLCTMGALVMLLVVVARNVREQSSVQAAAIETEIDTTNPLEKLTSEEADAILEQIRMGVEEADWFAEELSEAKNQFGKELEEKKTQLALIEKGTQKVKDELTRLNELAEQLADKPEGAQSSDAQNAEQLKSRLEQLKKQREAEELELAELQKEAANDAKAYAIIPYKGANGTYRRPIYIECRDDRVILQPEGVELYPNDFILADRPDNPFDAVLRVIRQYFIETNQIVRGTEPYPLLIVRPSGSETYSTTRKAIGTWIKEFGYELVDENWKIEYPQPSAELKDRIEKQLEASRNRMAGYLAAMKAAQAAERMDGTPQQYRLDHRGRVEAADKFLSQMDRKNGSPSQRSVRPMPNVLSDTLPQNPQPGPRPFGNKSSTPSYGKPSPQVAGQGIPGQSVPGQGGSPDISLAMEPQPATNVPSPPVGVIDTTKPNQHEPGTPLSNAASTPTPPQSKLSERKKGWALEGAVPFSAPMSRTIKIQCDANQFVFSSQQGGKTHRAIPIGPSVVSATDKLVSEIKSQMESWGMAGEKMYWRPILEVTVLPGGEERFKELQYLLQNSGLVVERKN